MINTYVWCVSRKPDPVDNVRHVVQPVGADPRRDRGVHSAHHARPATQQVGNPAGVNRKSDTAHANRTQVLDKSPSQGWQPENSTRDFWDERLAGLVLPNLLNRIGIPKIPSAGFA